MGVPAAAPRTDSATEAAKNVTDTLRQFILGRIRKAAMWSAEGSKKRCVYSYGGGAEGSVGSVISLPAIH